MNAMKFYRLQKVQPDEFVFFEGKYDYYSLTIDGYHLMYATTRDWPDIERLYVLSNELAKYLGFIDKRDMMKKIAISMWRETLGVKALKRRFR